MNSTDSLDDAIKQSPEAVLAWANNKPPTTATASISLCQLTVAEASNLTTAYLTALKINQHNAAAVLAYAMHRLHTLRVDHHPDLPPLLNQLDELLTQPGQNHIFTPLINAEYALRDWFYKKAIHKLHRHLVAENSPLVPQLINEWSTVRLPVTHYLWLEQHPEFFTQPAHQAQNGAHATSPEQPLFEYVITRKLWATMAFTLSVQPQLWERLNSHQKKRLPGGDQLGKIARDRNYNLKHIANLLLQWPAANTVMPYREHQHPFYHLPFSLADLKQARHTEKLPWTETTKLELRLANQTAIKVNGDLVQYAKNDDKNAHLPLGLRWNANLVVINNECAQKQPLSAFFEQNGWQCIALKLPRNVQTPQLSHADRLLQTLIANLTQANTYQAEFTTDWNSFQTLVAALDPADITPHLREVIGGFARIQEVRQIITALQPSAKHSQYRLPAWFTGKTAAVIQQALPDYELLPQTITDLL